MIFTDTVRIRITVRFWISMPISISIPRVLEGFLALSFEFLHFIIGFFCIKKKKKRTADINGKEKK